MNISVFGLGYVGTVSAGCLASDGHCVIGVDPNQTKVDLINQGQTPIIEKDIGTLIKKAVETSHLRAVTNVEEAIDHSDLSLVCVGTPSQLNGNLDLTFVRRVCEQIGAAIRQSGRFHVIAIRSTMLPGTMREIVIPFLTRASGKSIGEGYAVCVHPEFLREGNAVADFYDPPKILIGEDDPRCGDLLLSLYAGLRAPVIRTDIEVAEMAKYADNSWHALKVVFANEIGAVCKATGIDSHKVMSVFCADSKLNISSRYLKPGFAFGGSCLPKDVRAISFRGRSLDLKLPILDAILTSNAEQIERAMRMIIGQGRNKIGVLGFSFKAGTDDLRESPMVEVIERLLGKGYDLKIFDRNVDLARVMGANRDYILNHIPHISKLMVTTTAEVLQHAEVIVVGTQDPEFCKVLNDLRSGQVVVDLVRAVEEPPKEGQYDGIGW